jgi:23S rRNA (adenine2503-C2)-methyltransferase
MKELFLDKTLEEVKKAVLERGAPSYRAAQIWVGLYRKRAASFEEIPGIPRDLAASLDKKYRMDLPACVKEQVSKRDGTRKFLWSFPDGNMVESVLIKSGDRRTACLSTQAGCKFACPFCSSGTGGFKRDLSSGEIVGQFLGVEKLSGERITNLVFMGMGEPLDNYDNLETAILIINSAEGIALGARKITVSTCGIIPGINRLCGIGVQVELSVSLHAAYDALRNELVPANRKYPIKDLVKACVNFSEKTGRKITLEYAIIPGRNDSEKDARALAEIASTVDAKVNLIPCNDAGRYAGKFFKVRDAAEKFKKNLEHLKIPVTIRESRGTDILAACGQLAGTMDEKDNGNKKI